MSALPAVVEHGTGLVVMLDAAGRTIAQLEAQVERLTAALVVERQERERLIALLEELRRGPDASDVPQQMTSPTDNGPHDHTDPDRPPA